VLSFQEFYYLVQMRDGESERRHGPFDSEDDCFTWLKHEHLEGHFDIVKSVTTFKE